MNVADFKFTIPNLPQLREALASYPEISKPVIQQAVESAQIVIDKYKLQDIPHISTALQKNWSFQVGVLMATYTPLMSYAPYVEFGTGIYGPLGRRIYPTTKKALANRDTGWGPYRSIAGMKPNPFMERLVQDSQEDVDKLFAAALDKISATIAAQGNE